MEEFVIKSTWTEPDMASVEIGSTTLRMDALDMSPLFTLFKQIESRHGRNNSADNGQFLVYETDGRVVVKYRPSIYSTETRRVGSLDRSELPKLIADMDRIIAGEIVKLKALANKKAQSA